MPFFIAGITGYVGGALRHALVADGRRVYGCGRPSPTGIVEIRDFSNSEQLVGSFELMDLGEIFHELEITQVINLAASVRKDDSGPALQELLKANVEFTSMLAHAATTNECTKLVQISTYSTSVDGKSYTPQTLYAATKKAAEDIAIYFSYVRGLDLKILNFYDIYGPKQPHVRLINALGHALLDSLNIEISEGTQEFSPLYIDDAVNAIIHAMTLESKTTTSYGHWSVHGPEVMLVRDVPNRIANALGLTWGLNQVALTKPVREFEIARFIPRQASLPGWQAVTKFEMGIRETFGGHNETS
jgi:nucleoside-diphosphate-sugar epimerase